MTSWVDRGRIGTFVAGAVLGSVAGLLAATVALRSEQSRPPAPGPTISSAAAGIEERWTSTLAQADAAWGANWPRAIAGLESFRADYPDYVAAKEKLYAALHAYGLDLLQSDRVREGSIILERARILLPQRDEATSALLALTPVVASRASPEPIVGEVPARGEGPTSAPIAAAAPRRPDPVATQALAASPTKLPFAPPIAAAPLTATKAAFDPPAQARAPTPTKVPFAAPIQAREPTPTKAPFAPPGFT